MLVRTIALTHEVIRSVLYEVASFDTNTWNSRTGWAYQSGGCQSDRIVVLTRHVKLAIRQCKGLRSTVAFMLAKGSGIRVDVV